MRARQPVYGAWDRVVRLVVSVVAVTTLTWAGVFLYARAMSALGQVEPANARSMHRRPIPAGAGIVPILLVVSLGTLDLSPLSPLQRSLLVTCAGLAVISWIDDLVGLPPVPRLLAHILGVAWCLLQLPPDQRVMPWLPLLLERVLLGVAWIWFINLFNFMDGIDGLAGSEAVGLAIGYVATVLLVGLADNSVPLALLIAAATIGYLYWNWPPARVMMGDAGSIPFGFLTGWLMLDLALHGSVVAAIILPLFFWLDASITLLGRLARGKLPHHAHRDHFYQRAALGRGNARPVVLRVIAVNSLLIMLSLLSVFQAAAALMLATISIVLFLVHLEDLATRPDLATSSGSRPPQ
jgi:UDP-N-acetylmuramyl pentapeptide phosphotransferase/UDP-N-acetylglucosamine-1-phosphate transferase